MRGQPRERPENFEIDPRHPLADGLVFAGLGRHTGSVLYHDSSLFGNAGTLTNMDPPTDWVFDPTMGRWGLDFLAASSQTVQAGFTVGAVPLTISGWCYLPTTSGTHYIASCCTSAVANNSFALFVINGTLYARSRTTTGVSGTVAGVPANTWFHACGLFVSATERYAVLNGVSGAAQTTSSTPTSIDRTIIGNSGGAGTSFYDGQLADILIHSRALSLPEIQALADPSSVMLSLGGGDSGLLTYRRRSWAVSMPSAFPWLYHVTRRRLQGA